MSRLFVVTEEHIKLIGHLEFTNNDGYIGTYGRRPFGNSDIEGDILDILGFDKDDGSESEQEELVEYAAVLFDELHIVLNILKDNLCLKNVLYTNKSGKWRTLDD